MSEKNTAEYASGLMEMYNENSFVKREFRLHKKIIHKQIILLAKYNHYHFIYTIETCLQGDEKLAEIIDLLLEHLQENKYTCTQTSLKSIYINWERD